MELVWSKRQRRGLTIAWVSVLVIPHIFLAAFSLIYTPESHTPKGCHSKDGGPTPGRKYQQIHNPERVTCPLCKPFRVEPAFGRRRASAPSAHQADGIPVPDL